MHLMPGLADSIPKCDLVGRSILRVWKFQMITYQDETLVNYKYFTAEFINLGGVVTDTQ